MKPGAIESLDDGDIKLEDGVCTLTGEGTFHISQIDEFVEPQSVVLTEVDLRLMLTAHQEEAAG